MSTDSAAAPASERPDPQAFAAQALKRLHTQAPLVQCITNQVVTNFTANVLLAAGAAPAMIDVPGEAALFAGMASALLINLGTPVPAQAEGALLAARAASQAGTPWVLDPVAVGVLPVRTQLARELLELRPTVVRGNASEILALAGSGQGGRGVDASASVDDARDSASQLARRLHCVVAVSGPVDYITDGQQAFCCANGSPLLTRITGGGCALGALMAAFLARSVALEQPLHATLAAVACYTIAAELAVPRCYGPGSFSPALLDQLAALRPADILTYARLSNA